MSFLRWLRDIFAEHLWDETEVILPLRGLVTLRECRDCHRVEELNSGWGDSYWSRIGGLELIDLRREVKAFRRRWIVIDGRAIRKGAVALRTRAAIREADRLGLR